MAQVLNQTTLQVFIGGQDYSGYVQFPFKVSNLLDEQLDEASLTLIGVPDKIFKPLTAVTVTVTSGNQTQTYSMLVAEDKADEIPSGSDKYKHELYLIEQTKFLECFVVRNLGFVNPLMKDFAVVKANYYADYYIPSGQQWSPEYSVDLNTPLFLKNGSVGFYAPPLCKDYDNWKGILSTPDGTAWQLIAGNSKDAKISLRKNNQVVQEYTAKFDDNGMLISDDVFYYPSLFTITMPGQYEVVYSNFQFANIAGVVINTLNLIYYISVIG